jgi:hypothetical protein
MLFRWTTLGRWLLVSLILIFIGLALLGIPGILFYEGWRILLNTIFQHEMIANLGRLGAGAWAIAIYMSAIVPLGLPLSYIVTTRFFTAQMRQLSWQKASIWVVLLTLLWSLIPTFGLSRLVFGAEFKSPISLR